MTHSELQLIKGAGDIGSAVAHSLKRAGLNPVLLAHPGEVITRRRMAFGAAIHEGEALLEGLRGVLCAHGEAVLACLRHPDCVPVVVGAGELPPGLPPPGVVVDARMRKKQQAPVQLQQARLVIGIGPGFRAGEQVHAVVESNWGQGLGRVLWRGTPQGYTGRPRAVQGYTAERYLYAPHAGIFRTGHPLLARVGAGEVVARVDDTALAAPIAGVLRGLAYDGTQVEQGAKLVEVDPRGDPALCVGIGERPAKIAAGVLAAIREKMPALFASGEA